MQFELSVGDSPVSANLVDLSQDASTARDPSTAARARMRLPISWVINEFTDLARECDDLELSEENVADWLSSHFRQHPDDILVLVAMLRQAEARPPTPEWRWIGTDSVTMTGDTLTIDGSCQRVAG